MSNGGPSSTTPVIPAQSLPQPAPDAIRGTRSGAGTQQHPTTRPHPAFLVCLSNHTPGNPPTPNAPNLRLRLSPCMFPKPWICQGDSERAGTDRSPLGRERPRESRAVPALPLSPSSPHSLYVPYSLGHSKRAGTDPSLLGRWRPLKSRVIPAQTLPQSPNLQGVTRGQRRSSVPNGPTSAHLGRQAAQGGPRRLHAQAPRPLQRPLPAADHVGPHHALTLDAPTQVLSPSTRHPSPS